MGIGITGPYLPKIPHFSTDPKLVDIGSIGLQLVTDRCKLDIVQSGGSVGPSRL